MDRTQVFKVSPIERRRTSPPLDVLNQDRRRNWLRRASPSRSRARPQCRYRESANVGQTRYDEIQNQPNPQTGSATEITQKHRKITHQPQPNWPILTREQVAGFIPQTDTDLGNRYERGSSRGFFRLVSDVSVSIHEAKSHLSLFSPLSRFPGRSGLLCGRMSKELLRECRGILRLENEACL